MSLAVPIVLLYCATANFTHFLYCATANFTDIYLSTNLQESIRIVVVDPSVGVILHHCVDRADREGEVEAAGSSRYQLRNNNSFFLKQK